ncbi:ABC transporter permease [bacterium]|nr:ABC transporter permease [bacterium]MCI0680209.1 ABC transporter permease [bacterium]
MSAEKLWICFYTIVRKEIIRIFRVWTQTFVPPVITTTLYFLIFGNLIGSQIEAMNGVSYVEFIVPGLILMSVLTNSFQSSAIAFFMAKFQKSIEEILVSPTPPWIIVAGYVTGGVVRGVITGVLVYLVSLVFAPVSLSHIGSVISFFLLTSIFFATLGLINGVYAKNFDQISIIPTFVLTPLTYLGGVFYSISLLPPLWEGLSKLNPILYMVNGFRYGLLGTSDVPIGGSALFLFIITACALWLVFRLVKKGTGLRA